MRASLEQLFARFQRSGSPRALGQIYDRVGDELSGVAQHLASDPAAAEDLVQATFLTAIVRAESFEPGRRLVPWLMGILAHQARSQRRSQRRAPDALRLERRRIVGPEVAAQERELDEALERALASMAEHLRPVLVLRLRHGLSAAEIADALQRPRGTVRSQLARGLESLRVALPRGLTGAALLGVALPRGMAAVRATIVDQARASAPGALTVLKAEAAHALELLTPVLLMKKPVLLAVLVLGSVLVSGIALIGALDPPRQSGLPVATDELAPLASAQPTRVEVAAGESIERETLAEASSAPASAVTTPPDDPAPTASASLTLIVRDSSGQAVSGAICILREFVPGDLWSHGRNAISDERGRARFDSLEARQYVVTALRSEEQTVQLHEAESREVVLEWIDGIRVRGRVLDADSNPVPGAQIWLSERWQAKRGCVAAHADEAGAFELESVSPDHYVGARAPGFGMSYLQRPKGAPGSSCELTIVLETQAGRLSGEVVDELGAPIGGAQIMVGSELSLSSHQLADGDQVPVAPPQVVRSDASGAFRFEFLPAGETHVQLRARGRAPLAELVEVAAFGETRARFVLAPEARVQGLVTLADGRPAARALVFSAPRWSFLSTATLADQDGHYTLARLPEGELEIGAELRDHGRAAVSCSTHSGEELELDLQLALPPRILGRLLDEQGLPLQGWAIVAQDERTREQVGGASTRADGLFALDASAQASYKLLVRTPGDWRAFPKLVVTGVRTSTRVEDYRLPVEGLETGSLSLTALAPDGSPAIGARLELWQEELKLWRTFDLSEASGELRIDSLPPGSLQLTLRHADHPMLRLPQVVVHAGEENELGELRFETSGRLHGLLLGVSEPELLDTLAIHVVNARAQYAVVEREGTSFLTSPLAPGVYDMTVMGDFLQRVNQRVTIEEGRTSEVEVALQRAGLRVLLVTAAAEASPPGWVGCQVLDASGAFAWSGAAKKLDERTFELRVSLPPGSYSAVCRDNLEREASVTFELHGLDGGQPPIELELP